MIDQQPSNADAHSGYALLLAARNEPERAIGEFERALAIRADLDEVRLALAGVLERSGRSQEARVEYQRLADGRSTPEGIRRVALRRLALMRRP